MDIAAARDLTGTPAKTPAPCLEPAPDARRRVLVVEDNEDAAETLRQVLELREHVVEVAGTGPEGIAKAKSFRPDVVLCDIGLPELDGYAVARAIRAEPSLAGVHLVAVSGYDGPEDVERGCAAGFDRHVAKPLSWSTLERVLSTVPPRV